MKEKIVRCDICEKIVALECGYDKERIEHVNGVKWGEFGYSKGGWGRREDWFHPFHGDNVCDECFDALEEKILEFKNLYNERRGSNRTGISFYHKSKDEPKGDKVRKVQPNKLPPDGHKTPLLR